MNLPNYSDEHALNATSAYAMSTFKVNDALREYQDSAVLGELRQKLKRSSRRKQPNMGTAKEMHPVKDVSEAKVPRKRRL